MTMVLVWAAFPAHAKAAMTFCNRTQTPIEAAIGYQNKDKKWISEGWWRIEPGLCARVFSKPLVQHTNYFYFARALSTATAARDKSPFIWYGDYRFCTALKAFRIEGGDGCEQKGFETKGFRKIERAAGAKSYSLDFKDKP